MEEESGYIHSAHNVSNLIYHFVTPTKYRRLAIEEPVEESRGKEEAPARTWCA